MGFEVVSWRRPRRDRAVQGGVQQVLPARGVPVAQPPAGLLEHEAWPEGAGQRREAPWPPRQGQRGRVPLQERVLRSTSLEPPSRRRSAEITPSRASFRKSPPTC
ncbi:unnamed protein product [Prorocentrum cordatum]|uniref:Uncharacterized protein n=1 Tax=Prorocentrum cordatum TaxID=2364126 RepID=A0ABN9RPZ8_9DINO|nr:unnamed protein product [Polarella glacialis]